MKRMLFKAAIAAAIATTAMGKDYKMTTATPPGVASPDQVGTRLGYVEILRRLP